MNANSSNTSMWSSEVDASEILHSLPDAVLTTDRQMRINYFNQAACKLTGFSPGEAIGMYCKDVLKTGSCHAECPIKTALDAHENIFNNETLMTTAWGTKIPILISASLLMNAAGEVVGYLHVFRDISLIKKIMLDLQISRNNLAEKNVSLDTALKELQSTQEQLIQAQKMESMGTLAGGIAHDFNNILSGILGYASLLKLNLDPSSPLYGYTKTIEQASIKASRLTQQLLTFSRGGSCRLQVININKVVESTLTILERTIPKSIRIEKSFAPNLWTVEADASQIEQVLLNLCINARDAMVRGGVLRIRTENFSSPGNSRKGLAKGQYVRISVSDNGEGIPEEIQNKIFDPFFTTKGLDKGTGLGLAVAYGVIKNHKGQIAIQSTPGSGTTFDIYLPMSGKAERLKGAVIEAEIPRGSETILLVDDEQVIRELGKEALEKQGYSVLVAESGQQAIEMYSSQKGAIELVILDIIMPGMDGLETCMRLREIDPCLKIFISSGYSHDESTYKYFCNQVDGFLQKPYKIDELARMVRQVLDKQKKNTLH